MGIRNVFEMYFQRSAVDPSQRLIARAFLNSVLRPWNFLIKPPWLLSLRNVFLIRALAPWLAYLHCPGQCMASWCLHVSSSQCCHPVYAEPAGMCRRLLCFSILQQRPKALLENKHRDCSCWAGTLLCSVPASHAVEKPELSSEKLTSHMWDSAARSQTWGFLSLHANQVEGDSYLKLRLQLIKY